MKLLVVLSAVLAVALAKPGYLSGAHTITGEPTGLSYAAAPAAISYAAAPAAISYAAAPAVGYAGVHPGYAAYGPANIVIGSDGIPLDTPEVAATKAAHLRTVAETQVRDAIVNSAAVVAGSVAAAPVVAATVPEVIAARTPAATVLAAGPAAVGYAAGPAAISYAAHAGVFAPAARAVVAAPAGAVHYAGVHPGYAAYGPANIVIGPNGVPLDTPEVAAGKVADAVAHLEAKARNGHLLG